MNRTSAACLVAVPLLTAVAWAGGGVALPAGDGKKIIESSCVSCHGLDVLKDRRWSKEGWQTVVLDMVDRGASLKTGERAQVVSYLAKNFGGNDDQIRGKELVEDVCSLCHEWRHAEGHEWTEHQWAGLIKEMIAQAAPVTDEEFVLIVDYLVTNFGPAKDNE